MWEAAAYLHIFYHFFYNNSAFVLQNIIVEERNFCVFTIFFVHLKKTIIFGVLGQRLCPELFDPYCQLIIPGPLFCLDCLSPMMASIISSWSWRSPSYETLFSTVVLFLLCSCDDDTRPWSKSLEIFCCLSLSPFNSVTTWQDDEWKLYLNLLHVQGVALEDAGESGLVQNEQSLEWSLLLEGQQGLKKDWEVESTANWVRVHFPAFETRYFPFMSLLTSFCRGFLCKVSVAGKGSRAICVISACCWFIAILETRTVRVIGGAVFWTGACSVIVVMGVSTRLLLSVLGTDVIGGNFKLVSLVLVCSTDPISKQICKKS